MARVDGVGEASILGVGESRMRDVVESRELRARNLATDEVVAAIRQQNIQVAAGRSAARPPRGHRLPIGPQQHRPADRTRRSSRHIIRGSRPPPTDEHRVSDVARVELGSDNYDLTPPAQRTARACLAIFQIPGSKPIEVANGVKATSSRSSRRLPRRCRVHNRYDPPSRRRVDQGGQETLFTPSSWWS